MTREEAITELSVLWERNGEPTDGRYREALDMAISALSENKGELISRQAVLDELEKWDWQDLYLPIHFKQILDGIPSVENKGEWKEWKGRNGRYNGIPICSNCHTGFPIVAKDYNFCPNCGARMGR